MISSCSSTVPQPVHNSGAGLYSETWLELESIKSGFLCRGRGRGVPCWERSWNGSSKMPSMQERRRPGALDGKAPNLDNQGAGNSRAEVAEWQTRYVQGVVSLRAWGFK